MARIEQDRQIMIGPRIQPLKQPRLVEDACGDRQDQFVFLAQFFPPAGLLNMILPRCKVASAPHGSATLTMEAAVAACRCWLDGGDGGEGRWKIVLSRMPNVRSR